MNYRIVQITPVSLTVEIDDQTPFFSEKKREVLINGKAVLETNENVFTVFDLTPNTEYTLSIDGIEVGFKTESVSCILYASSFRKENPSRDDTLRLNLALAYTPKGGRLILDEKEYHVTSLRLHSDRTLLISKGTILYGNPNAKDYPLLPKERYDIKDKKRLPCQSWEGDFFVSKPSLLNRLYAKNVTLVGQGTINGRADQSEEFWHDVKKLPYGRPSLFYTYQSEDIRTIGLTFKNSPAWTIHPFLSKKLSFLNLYIENPKDAPNTDGRDPEACCDIEILGIRFSVGDDCIALKSNKRNLARERKTPLSNCLIRNCYRKNGHGAIVLGSEAAYGIKDIQVERCLFEDTDRGLRIKTRRGRGKESIRDNIVFKDIVRHHVLTPLVRNRFYFCDPDGKDFSVQDKNPHPVTDRTPYLGSFTFEDIHADDCEVAFGFFYGLPEQKIKSITIKDSSFSRKKEAKEGFPARLSDIEKRKKQGFVFYNVESVTLRNVKTVGREGKRACLNQVSSFKDDE